MVILRFLLLATAIAVGSAQKAISYVDSGIPFTGIQETQNNITFGFALPPLNDASLQDEFIGQIIAPIANKWVGVAFGGSGSLGAFGFPNGTHVLGTPRLLGPNSFNVPATVYTAANVSTIASSINATHWNWIYRCENCTAWPGGNLAVNGTQPRMSWLISLNNIPAPVAENSTLSPLTAASTWSQNLATAHIAEYSTLLPNALWTRKPDTLAQSRYGPAIATHAGGIWVVGAMNDQSLWYASGNNQAFTRPPTLINDLASEGPALADFNGVLHLVFPNITGGLTHYQYNDSAGTWGQRISTGFKSGQPTLTSFNNALVLIFLDTVSNGLRVSQWTNTTGWSAPFSLAGSSWGTPALFALQGVISVLFPANNGGRALQQMSSTVVNPSTPWKSVLPPDESTAFGVGAAASGNTAVAVFQSNNGKGQVFATFFNPTTARWAPHEDVGQTTSHTPAVAILDGVVNCIFASHDSRSVVFWSQRSVPLA